jgi:outer membrane protein TolC
METGSRFRAGIYRVLLFLPLFTPASVLAEPVTLRQAVELALQHASGVGVAAAEERRATANYHELRNSYIPQLNAGAGIGWSDGFPLSLEGSAPSLFNVNAQSALLHPELKYFLQADRSDIKDSALRMKDQRNGVIQDTVLSYAELAKWERRLSGLRETQGEEEKMQAAVEERVKEGVDSELDATKARLSVARVRLRVAEASGAADVLREHLAKLTGMPTMSFEIDAESMPGLPAAKEEEDLPAKSTDANPSVQAAVEHARAQYLRVKGERRALLPSVDFAAQYANIASFNNYEQVYRNIQPNNATVGVSIHLPFFNLAQHSRIEQAEAEADRAKKQAEGVKNQVSEETLRLQRSVTQMQAARDVAELEYEIAQQNVEAVKTRMESSTANLHDLDNAQIQVSERFITLQDVTFELERSEVGLMRATGELEGWAMGTK